MANYDLGTAKGRIEVDGSGVKPGVDEANKALGGLDESAKKSSASLAAISGAGVAMGAATVAGFTGAIKVAADFEEQLSGIKAVSGATTKEMEKVRKKALQLGADTSFSASESAAAMEELIKAGLTVDDVLNGAADATVNLAAAGGVALPEAATIAANAMNQFGLSAEQMPHVADLIAGAANASAIDVSDFGLSLAQAGAVANLTGLKFDDLALAITAMGNAGIKGSDAGTSLKTFLTGLQPTTEKQIDLFYDLGLAVEENGTAMNEMGNAFFTGEGQIKSMSEIAGTLATALAGMSEQQKIATLETLFGSDAIRAAAIIADTGAEGFDTLAASMGGITAADVAATRLDNFNGSVEQLKGSLETLLINVGTPFLGFFREVVERLTDAVNWFNELDSRTQVIAASAVGATGALAGLLGTVGLFASASAPAVHGIATMGSGIGSLVSTLVTSLGVWGVLILAIAAIAVGIYLAYQRFEGFREIVDQVIDRIQALGQIVWEWIQNTALPALQEFGEYFMANLWPQIKAFVTQALKVLREFADFFVAEVLPRIRAFVDRAIEVVGNIISFIVDDAVPAIARAWDKVAQVAVDAWEWIDKNIISTVTAMVNLIIAVMEKIIDFTNDVLVPAISSAWDVLAPIIQFVFDTVVNTITTAMTVIATVIQTVIDAIMIIWNLFGDNIISAIVIAFGYIQGIIETVMGIIRGIIQIITALITGDWDLFLTGLRTIWDAIWNGIKTVVETIIGAIRLAIETFIDTIEALIKVGLEAIKLAWDLTWTAIKQVIETTWSAIKLAVETAINAVKAVIETTINTVKSVWESVWGSISSFFSGIWDDITSKVTGAVDTISSAISGAWDTVSGYFTDTWNSIRDGFSTVWDEITGFVEDGIQAIFEFIGGIPAGVVEWLGDGFNGIWEAFKAVINRVIDAWNALELPSFTIGGWDPPGPGPTFPSLTIGPIGVPNIPRLANGGVATAESMALIGDYPGVIHNPEIVSPQSIMRETLMEALGELISSGAFGGGVGPAEIIHIDEYNVHDPSDADALLTQAEFAYQGGRFGG